MDMTPGPAPVYRALKVTPSAHQREEELQEATSKTGATVGARLSPPRVHSRTAGPRTRDIGHRDEQLWNVHGQTNSLDHGISLCATTGK